MNNNCFDNFPPMKKIEEQNNQNQQNNQSNLQNGNMMSNMYKTPFSINRNNLSDHNQYFANRKLIPTL